MVTIKAHFDGKVLVPDEPLDLAENQAVILNVKPLSPAEPAITPKPSVRDLVGRALLYPQNPNPRNLTDDELWEKPKP